MFAPLLLFALSALGQTPNDSFSTALADLRANVPAESRHYTRYVSLAAVPDAARPDYVKVFTYAINATSFRATLARPVVLTDTAGVPILLRLDLRAMEWDKGSRSVRLAELERRGVDFKLKDSEARRTFLDPWELFARDDPYYFTNTIAAGKVTRGWIDPDLELAARLESFSVKFVLRADWLLSRLLVEKDRFNGYYSLLLMLPPNEADLYKAFLIDVKAIREGNNLQHGGAVLESNVAHNNRELQLIPGTYGFPLAYLWRTYDVAVAAGGDKSVIVAKGGTLKHDGREIIASLPNGLHWTYLCDGGTNNDDGKQVATVPDNIAIIKTPLVKVRDTRVTNSYTCAGCHFPKNGIIPFDDVIGSTILNENVGLLVSGPADKFKVVSALRSRLEDYYLSPLGIAISLQQDVFAARLKECCGLSPAALATLLITDIEDYIFDLESPAAAAREMGVPLLQAVSMWRNSVDLTTYRPDEILVVLSSGKSVPRAVWEQSFGNAMRATLHPWETPHVVVPVVPAQLQAKPRR